MTLFMISVPLMALAAALAVLPLIYMSRADHRRRMAECYLEVGTITLDTHRRRP